MIRTYQLVVLGGALIVIAVPALINPYRFTGLGDRFWLWCLLMTAGFVLLTVAVVRLAIARRGLRRRLLVLGAVCLAPMALLGLAMAYFSTWLVDYSNEQRVAAVSADGRFAVIVTHPPDRADLVTNVYVQSTDGFFGRRDHLGCPEPDSVRFTGPDTIAVGEAGEVSTVRFDPGEVRLVGWHLGDSCPPDRLYTG